MARSYEYVIHGRPLSATGDSPLPRPKTLSSTRDSYRKSNLRNLYRTSISSTDYVESPEPLPERRISSPTTPRLPPTPPTGEEGEAQGDIKDEPRLVHDSDAAALRSMPVTPVNQNSPPTPDDTPPRGQLKLPLRPFLAVRPSIASTQAESFSTARENIYSDDESEHFFPAQVASTANCASPPELPPWNEDGHEHDVREPSAVAQDEHAREMHDEIVPPFPLLPAGGENRLSQDTMELDHDTPVTKFGFDNLSEQAKALFAEPVEGVAAGPNDHNTASAQVSSFYDEITRPTKKEPTGSKGLRDRVKAIKHVQNTASTEAFANVIGWNDGGVHRGSGHTVETNRWSGLSNPSAVEAYVVDSPIKPRKRGTLRKVVKNDSLRSTSSPIPESKRTSLQSASDSSHRLVHKKQKLNNENRWSVSSEISRRSMSWGSTPAWVKQEVVKMAAMPERNASLRTSASSSRRHSRSISGGSAYHAPGMLPFATPMPPPERTSTDAKDKIPADTRASRIPVGSTSLSPPTSGSGSRANSVSSQQFSTQRKQAEKDLRKTLERMESERLSASLRQSSHQSTSPTPAPRPIEQVTEATLEPITTNSEWSRKGSSPAASARSHQKSATVDVSSIDPGTKEWAELRPTAVGGTPFSQASMLSTSPEIVEARAVSFFPHNNQSLQLIEPNRLSETPAVTALREQGVNRAQTLPSRTEDIATPRTSHQIFLIEEDEADSPLRNPRKPPEPPTTQSSAIPPTPASERGHQLGETPDTSPAKSRTDTAARRRPSLPGRDRSQSFIKSLSRNMGLRNAKNPKQDQELDSTLNPFWRPKAFWDDDDYRRRMQQERDREQDVYDDSTDKTETGTIVRRAVVIQDPGSRLVRSNTIMTGPMSLVRKMSERRKQRRVMDEHIASQQALVKQTSYSSLQRLRAGRKLYGLPPIRTMSLNVGVGRLSSLREKLAIARARKEEERRELKREKLRKSIGPEVISQGDSRFPSAVVDHTEGRKVDSQEAIGDMLQQARAEEVVGKRGLRL